jgi:sugar lactone lactonase YvrE
MTPQGVLDEFVIPGGAYPIGIVAGPDGNLWFTEYASCGIGRMTPQGELTEFPVAASSGPWGITTGPDGNLWFTEYWGNEIGRITPAGDVTEFVIPSTSSNPVGIAQGSDGNLWFTEGSGGKIGRISTSGVFGDFRIPDGGQPEAITAGPDGNIWFTANEIGRLVPSLAVFMSPSSGAASGGTAVVVTGIGFASDASLTIGGVPAENVIVHDATEIDATAPALPAGTLNDVVLFGPAGTVAVEPRWFADFLDVPQGDLFHQAVETIFRSGVTAGCGGGSYCRDNPVRRDQMAVFLLKVKHGPSFVPGPCTGLFPDVPCSSPFASWIEDLWLEGITGGCGGGNYCPDGSVAPEDHLRTIRAGALHGLLCRRPVPESLRRLDRESLLRGRDGRLLLQPARILPRRIRHSRPDGGFPGQGVRPAVDLDSIPG